MDPPPEEARPQTRRAKGRDGHPAIEYRGLVPYLAEREDTMAKVRITRNNGSTTPYFWSDKEQGSKNRKTVYKQTAEGVKRMRGVRFDPVENRMHKV